MTEIVTIDCDYLAKEFAAAYLLIRDGEAAFVDNNTTHSVPLLLEALRAQGLGPDAVRYAIVTHVHLDHAGGTSALMRACPGAQLLAHPRAAPHLIDPGKLVASARQVYGDARFEALYGRIDAVPAARVRTVGDEEVVPFGTGMLRFLHTRGHANHHFCVATDGPVGPVVFTGDAFGLQYPALQKRGRFILPSTSPTDFDAQAAIASVDRIVGTQAVSAYPTHFGEVRDLGEAAAQLKEHLGFSGELLERVHARWSRGELQDTELSGACREELVRYLEAYVARRRLGFGPAEWDLLELDLDLNAEGIAFRALRRGRSPSCP
jgi:glyoxylase-like metal-dependent hydrolase (beta-lactamase superfamily II)